MTMTMWHQRSAELHRQIKQETISIVTHNGVFHADEVAAIALLKQVCPGSVVYRRTRDLGNIAEGTLVLDVGEGLWDHHGPALEANGEIAPGVPHCAASLVYQTLVNLGELPPGGPLEQAIVSVAAQDNGVGTDASNPFAWVRHLNPPWDKPGVDYAEKAFKEAVDLATPILGHLVQATAATEKAEKVLGRVSWDKPVVELPVAGLPWVEYLHRVGSPALYVVFPAGGEEFWRVQCVPESPDQPFTKRKPLPQEWAGRRGEDLDTVSGIPGGIFCHAGLFISGWETLEAAHKAAVAAVQK